MTQVLDFFMGTKKVQETPEYLSMIKKYKELSDEIQRINTHILHLRHQLSDNPKLYEENTSTIENERNSIIHLYNAQKHLIENYLKLTIGKNDPHKAHLEYVINTINPKINPQSATVESNGGKKRRLKSGSRKTHRRKSGGRKTHHRKSGVRKTHNRKRR